MIIDAQEYLYEWEKANNPFYPNEMKWDRLTVNKFLCDYKQQLPIASHAVLADVCELLTMIENIYPIVQGRAKWNPDEVFIALVKQVERCRAHFR